MTIIGLQSLRKFKAWIRPRPKLAEPTYQPGKSCLHPAVAGDDYVCKCHRQMGNDFWFLPTGSCLFAKIATTKPKPETFPTCSLCGKVDHDNPFPRSAMGCNRDYCL